MSSRAITNKQLKATVTIAQSQRWSTTMAMVGIWNPRWRGVNITRSHQEAKEKQEEVLEVIQIPNTLPPSLNTMVVVAMPTLLPIRIQGDINCPATLRIEILLI